MDTLISIIVPIYNIENNITYCLDSILNQSYKEIEVLLIDDGSTDFSGEICDKYAQRDNRVRVIHQKNRGLSGARNAGLDSSLGSMIMFVDGDDIIDSRMVEILEKDLCSAPNYLYSSCRFQRIAKYKLNPVSSFDSVDMNARSVAIDLLNGTYENISSWGKLYKKEKIGKLRFTEGRIHFEDKVFLFRLLLNNPDMEIVERKAELYGYYERDNSITRTKFNKHSMDILYHSKLILDITCKEMPEYQYLGEKSDAISHLMVLKSIIRSNSYCENKRIFNSVKRELLMKYGNMPYSILGRYKSEIIALKVANWAYILCVHLFDYRRKMYNTANRLKNK